MAGGTWIDQNKVRPGVYINYKSAPASLATMGERGTVAIARVLDWGEQGKFYTIESPSDCAQLGHSITDPEMLFVRQILLGSNRTQGATKILVWALNQKTTTTAAKAVIDHGGGTLTVTSKLVGEEGNKLSVEFVDGSSGGYIKCFTKYNGEVVATSSDFSNPSGHPADNSYVSFFVSGSPIYQLETVNLSGGETGASKATATISDTTATAKYPGTYGNRLSFDIEHEGDGSPYTINTYLDGVIVDSQTFTSWDGSFGNDYVTFDGDFSNGGIRTALTGGANGTPATTAYSDFLNALELQKFDIVIYDGTDATIKTAFADFVKRLSNQEGVKCQAVLSDATNPDNECIINVYPQAVTLTDGTELAASELTWWVGGASAGANVFESLTYASYPDAVEVDPVLTSSQQEAAINAGKFALISQFDRIQVLTDINSFVTFAVEKGKAFRKNRVIRTIFGLCNDIYKTFATYYIGAVHNDEEGRNSLKAEILNLMNRYQGNRALQNVEADDVTVSAGVDSDAVVIEVYIQPVDSIEKIYINITIS